MDKYGNPVIVRSKTFRSWMRHHFTNQQLKEMYTYGVSAGYYGLIDRRDISRLYGRFRDEIQECISDKGWTLASFVEHVNPDDMDDLEGAMTWYAAEALAEMIAYQR
jgi:hypothetical protein